MNKSSSLDTLIAIFQFAAFVVLALCAIALTFSTITATLGMQLWPSLTLSVAGVPVENAGMYAQIALTVLALILLVTMPSHLRVLRLQDSVRDFSLTMEDVAQAYQKSHEADRQGLFQLSREFDSVRMRMEHIRNHPDLASLEPDVIELAALMSHEARDIANVYSDDKVQRARTFLQQRQQEVETYAEQIGLARRTLDELKRWNEAVDIEEALADQQKAQLMDDLDSVLKALGIVTEGVPNGKVVEINGAKTRRSPSGGAALESTVSDA